MKDKLRKIYELAKRGDAGERENASALLEKLLAQNNLTLADIADEETARHWWKYRNAIEKALLIQVIGKVKNINRVSFYQYKKQIGTDTTKLQAVEIELLFDTYRKALAEEIKKATDRAFHAFVQANSITADSDENDPSPELTPEQIKELIEIMCAAQKMGATPLPRKQLSEASQ